jgi:hypothetical protein
MEFQIINPFVGDGFALNLRIALAWPPSSRRRSGTRDEQSSCNIRHFAAACTRSKAPAPPRRRRLPSRVCLCIIIAKNDVFALSLLEIETIKEKG